MINFWIGEGYTTTISAAGTTQATATAITAAFNNITTAAASSGVQLPQVAPGIGVMVFNSGANAVKVYPPTGHQLNNLGANTGVLLAQNTGAIFVFCQIPATSQWFVFLSA